MDCATTGKVDCAAVGGQELSVGTVVRKIGFRMTELEVAGGGSAGWLAWIADDLTAIQRYRAAMAALQTLEQ